ncbi:MAG: hypothetical protein LBP59_10135 [Planctomycetaceae bacterium]|jgi:hypothetical protein|nr:hypothetical protein [Planctomycetaceae bacterium]
MRHELYHKHCFNTWGGVGPASIRNGHSDQDGLSDDEEVTPTSHAGVSFPKSDPKAGDSHGFGSYGTISFQDQEVRCIIIQTENPMKTYPDKDWSACDENPNW